MFIEHAFVGLLTCRFVFIFHQISSARSEITRIKLEDIRSAEHIEQLSIKCLKRLLLNNFVDYKGCCERWELQERVKRLWNDDLKNKQKGR